MGLKFSASLGYLWTGLSLPDAIRAAKKAGFSAVECHWPYDTDPMKVLAALNETGLPMLGINAARGNLDAGEFGLSAVPGMEMQARETIDQAVSYAAQIGAKNIHVMAGITRKRKAEATFVDNLNYACEQAGKHSITILIEPLNQWDVPGYYLQTTAQAAHIIKQVGRPNLKLMFDCYHVERQEGKVLDQLHFVLPIVGHIQFANTPMRSQPDIGELDYAAIFDAITEMGWHQPLGAEYKPDGPTEATLDWLAHYQ